MLTYAAVFEKDDDGYFVSFRDIPEALTQGDTLEGAMQAAQDALVTAIDFYFEDGRQVPPPSPAQAGEVMIALPTSVATKVLLLNAMVEDHIRPANLAKAMEVKPQEVTRILNLHHATKIDTLEKAFRSIGRELQFSAPRAHA